MKKSKIKQDFSEYLIRNYTSEDTIRTYNSCCNKFVNLKHHDTIEKLSEKYLLKYLTCIKEKYSISVYNQTLSVLKLIYNNLLNQNKLKDVYCLRQYPKLKNLPDIEEVIFKIKSINFIKHKAILLTLLMTGLRMSELLNIKLSDIKRNSMQIIIQNAKGGRSEFVIMPQVLLNMLEKYYKECKPKLYLFEGINYKKYSASSVNKIIKKYIGSEYSAHWMRHLAITYIINKKFSLPQAKLFSRHKSDSAIHFYYHYDNSLHNELRNSMEELAA